MANERNTKELLSEVYRNVRMGNENLNNVVPMIKDRFLMTNVTCQMERYTDYIRQAERLMGKAGSKAAAPSMMKRMMARCGVAMNTMFDSSDAHIAEMIVKGTRMGADTLEETLYRLGNTTEQGARELARAVVSFERSEANRLKSSLYH